MNARANVEKYAIMSELDSVARELEHIAADLQRMKGIGAELCSSKLLRLADKYNDIRTQLQYRV